MKKILLFGACAVMIISVYFCYNSYKSKSNNNPITTNIQVLSENKQEKELYVTAYKDMGDYVCTIESYVTLKLEEDTITAIEFMNEKSSAYSKDKNNKVKWVEGYANAQVLENNQLKLSARGSLEYEENSIYTQNILS